MLVNYLKSLTANGEINDTHRAYIEYEYLRACYVAERLRIDFQKGEFTNTICVLFYFYHKMEYWEFLKAQLDYYGNKGENNYILEKVLTETHTKNAELGKSPIFWTKSKGAKIDIIKLLTALYDLKYIVLENEQYPTKEFMMSEFGKFLNIDLSGYESNLYHALDTTSLETNLKFFDKMRDIIQKLAIKKIP